MSDQMSDVQREVLRARFEKLAQAMLVGVGDVVGEIVLSNKEQTASGKEVAAAAVPPELEARILQWTERGRQMIAEEARKHGIRLK